MENDPSNIGVNVHVQPTVSSPELGLNNTLQEILFELRGQKSQLNTLEEEVRGQAVAVGEVKKLKVEKDIRWKFEGNRQQFVFNSELEGCIKQGQWALDNNKTDYAREIFSEMATKVHTRNKHIRIADSSDGGWETVRQYATNPLASDSDDESRIIRADSRALRKKKQASKSKVRAKTPAVAYGYSDSIANSRGAMGGVHLPNQSHTGGANSFRGYSSNQFTRPGFQGGACFACGEANHFRRNCPYTRSSQFPHQPEQPVKK